MKLKYVYLVQINFEIHVYEGSSKIYEKCMCVKHYTWISKNAVPKERKPDFLIPFIIMALPWP